MEPGQAQDATRRTRLANERTQLAWWRTGLASVAVGLAVGKIIPEIASSTREWPYAVVGVGFVLYGVVLFWYGNLRARAVSGAVDEGGYVDLPRPAGAVLAAAGALLGLATGALIVLVD